LLLAACGPLNNADQLAGVNDNSGEQNTQQSQHFLSPVNRYDKLSSGGGLGAEANGNLTIALDDLLGSNKAYMKYDLHLIMPC